MKKTNKKIIAISLLIILVASFITFNVFAQITGSYTIKFTGAWTIGNVTVTSDKVGPAIVLDANDEIELTNFNSETMKAYIEASDGFKADLVVDSNGKTKISTANCDGLPQATLEFKVADKNSSGNNPTNTGGFEVKFLENAGDVWYKFGNGEETKISSDIKNIPITSGTMTIRIEDRTLGAVFLFINGSQQNIDRDAFKSGYTFNVESTDNIYFEIQYMSDSGTDINPNITVTAGNGTYGTNNTPYDAGTEENFIDVRISDTQESTVTFTFETLWIGRFYEDIVINGTPYLVSNYLDFDNRTQWLTANHGTQLLSFDIPNVEKDDSYNVVVKHGENTGKKYLATFLWTADPEQASGHDYIGNAKLEFVKAVYSVGDTKYTVTENDLEGKLQKEGTFMNAASDDGFLRYGVTADVDYDDGSLTLPGNAEITMRVVPEYGYQVTSVNGGNDFKTTDAGVSEFTVTVADGTAGYFQATVKKVDNTVTPTSEKVKSGNITLGDNASSDIKNGTVRLSVEDVELTSDKITNFEEKANEAGDYTITNYLDINLDKVLYKGTADDVWSEQIHNLTDKALITLQLEEGVDASNIVIVHNIDNGDEYEIIPIESYDAETNTISFYTNSFSNYAIANKISDTTENAKTTDTSSNPTTGDNIIMIISIFAIATLGTFTTVKLNKKCRVSKH